MATKVLTRIEMQDDLQSLCRLLVESHPDPFWGSKGPVPFYRRVNDVYRGLPPQATAEQFLVHLRPMVALLRDGHTTIGQNADISGQRKRVWIDFDAVEEGLFAARVYSPEQQHLLGGRLVSLNGVSVPDLCERIAGLFGCDNQMQALCRLADAFLGPETFNALFHQAAESELVLALECVDGSRRNVLCSWTETSPGSGIEPRTAIPQVSTDTTQMGWTFLADDRRTALLKIGPLMRYREAGETWLNTGYHQALRDWYAEIYGRSQVPSSGSMLKQFVDKVPSATAVLHSLTHAMDVAKTGWLVVDLSESIGGNSAIARMLGRTLYGERAILDMDEGYQIRRHSPLHAKNYGTIPDTRLAPGGYDFAEEEAWMQRQESRRDLVSASTAYAEWLDRVPTFRDGLKNFPTLNCRVVVVTSAQTYSAGFDILLTLKSLGARHVGVPSSQAPNCFIDTLRYSLPHSNLSGTISFKLSLAFPQDPDMRLLRPDRELTYQKLLEFGFDPASGIRLALEGIKERSL